MYINFFRLAKSIFFLFITAITSLVAFYATKALLNTNDVFLGLIGYVFYLSVYYCVVETLKNNLNPDKKETFFEFVHSHFKP